VTELERRLVAAAPAYPFPETPDLAGAARARLPERRARSRRRLALAGALVAAALAASVLALSPGARSAIGDLLDLVPGISIERVEQLPLTFHTAEPQYGAEVGFEEAERRFGRPLRLPRDVGEVTSVHWLQYPPGDMITTVYDGQGTGARLVFSQWKTGGPDLFYKSLSPQTTARMVRVGRGTGVWISGGPHVVWFHSPDIDPETHYAVRGTLAGNVLAWRRGDVIYRLEADVPLARAAAIARSLEER
jgi:hypothetical protein